MVLLFFLFADEESETEKQEESALESGSPTSLQAAGGTRGRISGTPGLCQKLLTPLDLISDDGTSYLP